MFLTAFVAPTLAEMITSVTGVVTTVVPDFSVYIAAAVVVGIAAGMARRFLSLG